MIQQSEDRKPSVCPFKVRVDTREQAPWRFTGIEDGQGNPLIVPLITDVALPTGDYSIEGMEHRVTVERKSITDFFQSVGSERERFEREFERMASFEYAAVVIEGEWREILIDPPSRVRMSPKAAAHTMAAWSIRYGVHFWPCMDRRHAEIWTFRLLQMFWRQDQHAKQLLTEQIASQMTG